MRDSFGRYALVATLGGRFRHAPVPMKSQLLCDTFSLQGRAGQLDAKATVLAPHDLRFKPAKALDVENDLLALVRYRAANDLRACWRHVDDATWRFASADRHEKLSGDVYRHAKIPAPIFVRLG